MGSFQIACGGRSAAILRWRMKGSLRMKKVFLMLMAALFFLSACSLEEMESMKKFYTEDSVLVKETYVQLLDVLSRRDHEQLKGMLSPKVRQNPDLDQKIEDLFDYIEGDILPFDEETQILPAAEMSFHHGGRSKKLLTSIDLVTDEQKYIISLQEYVVDTIEPDNEGIESIYIAYAKNYTYGVIYQSGSRWDTGINIEYYDS